MRIHAMPLPQAYGKHTSSVDAGQRTSGAASEKTKAGAAATTGLDTESTAVPAAGSSEQPESGGKLTPAGLLAAQLRFQSMNSEDMNKGQARAFEVISRNIERYRTHHQITTETPVPDTTAGTAPTTVTQPSTDTDQTDGAGTTSTPQPVAGIEPTTGEADATLPVDQAAVT